MQLALHPVAAFASSYCILIVVVTFPLGISGSPLPNPLLGFDLCSPLSLVWGSGGYGESWVPWILGGCLVSRDPWLLSPFKFVSQRNPGGFFLLRFGGSIPSDPWGPPGCAMRVGLPTYLGAGFRVQT